MKKNTHKNLYKIILTCINAIALLVPFIAFGITYLSDVLQRHFASLSVSHNETSTDFENDLDYSYEKNKLDSFNDYSLATLNNLGYLNIYSSVSTIKKVQYETNDVNTFSDLIVGRYYQLNFYDPVHQLGIDESNLDFALDNFDYIAYYYELYLDNLYSYDFYYEEYISPYDFRPIFSVEVYGSDDYHVTLFFNSTGEGVTCHFARVGYSSFIIFKYSTDMAFIFNNPNMFNYVTACDLDYLPPQYEEVENDITSLDDWKNVFEGNTYNEIYSDGVRPQLLCNLDFVGFFGGDNLINYNGNIATYLFINFYCNYFINITLLLLFPYLFVWLIDFIKKLGSEVLDNE